MAEPMDIPDEESRDPLDHSSSLEEGDGASNGASADKEQSLSPDSPSTPDAAEKPAGM